MTDASPVIDVKGTRELNSAGDLPPLHTTSRRETGEAGSGSAGPDVICVGLQKAATGWLYDQLAQHPDFWMPPIKEIHFFDRVPPSVRSLQSAQQCRLRAQRRKQPLGARNIAFLDRYEETCRAQAAFGDYAALFDFKGSLKSGDITPGYSTLPVTTVQAIAGWLPKTKIIVLVRDPIERFWSLVCMLLRRGEIDHSAASEPRVIRALVANPRTAARSYPSEISERWRRAFGESRIRIFFFDDIVESPGAVRSDILTFLGADPAIAASIDAAHNRKAGQGKMPMPDTIRLELIGLFRDELLKCHALFGEPAEKWCRNYGLGLRIASGGRTRVARKSDM